MKKALLITVLLSLASGWMYIIYNLSAMNTQNSNGKSTEIIALFIEDTLDVTNEYGITNSNPSATKLAKVSQLINPPMRKVMHASVYFVLAFFIILFMNILMNNKHYWIALIITMIICVGYAASDEYHQTFVSGRTGQPMDVCIDSAGAAAGTALYTAFYIVYKMGYKTGYTESDSKKISNKNYLQTE